MKLISCRIENFGKLRDFTYHFEDGLSVLFAENGWGKSTFAAFLKVMFYGFDGDNRRSEDGSERLRYRPWGGGVYGGSVIWSRGDKTYRMLRTFGTRRKEDTFVLYDEETGLPSGDFSENTGEELFGIDRDSFRRTVFWSQSDHETSATTSIQAKIGDLSSQQDDLPAYDAAVKRLSREMERLRPDRASGLIRKKEDRLAVLQADEARLPLLKAELEECSAKERALSDALCVCHCRHCFSGSRSVIDQGDGFISFPHFLKRSQCRGLMLFQRKVVRFYRPGFLTGKVIRYLTEGVRAAEKKPEFVLDRIGLILHLSDCPSVNVPAQMNHAVLFQKVIPEFILRNKRRMMTCFIVNFNGNFSDSVFYQKIRISVVVVNIVEMILTVEKTRLFSAECIGEKLNEHILRRAARNRVQGSAHIIILLPRLSRFQEKFSL